ncbi:unnamed protein product [Rotaria sp. Silwood2]|nr:unnamed protein product [Rotaria sp. Silwood2]CAF4475317.1 unnamed protein product [Rotaria sp. Silwood2]
MFVHRFLILTTIGLLFATVLNVQGKAIITVADSSSEHTDTDLENLPEIPVFGHTNPDTDAIGSAIAYTAYLREHKTNAKAYRLGTLNKETLYVLNYTGAEMPPLLPDNIANGSQVILVDHNESPQSMKNLKYMQVIRVVDHHKIGDLTTVFPVYLRFEPVGCAATVLAKTFFENNFKIKRTIAQLIISAIISDTLYFRTASTTADDHYVVEKLQGISEIKDLEAYSTEMFKAKSDLSGYTTRQILLLDYKSYVFNGQSWGIGVADTWYPDFLFNLKKLLAQSLAGLKM